VRSARAIIDGLDRDKYEVFGILYRQARQVVAASHATRAGCAAGNRRSVPGTARNLRRGWHHAGTAELAGLAYVGAGVLGSAVSMDKEMTKRVCMERMLPVVDFVSLPRGTANVVEACAALPFPVFVKPANLGSSVGISKAHNARELEAAFALAAEYDRKVIVERGIVGRELECAVLGNEAPAASLPCEILPSREFYDYDDKYTWTWPRPRCRPICRRNYGRTAAAGGGMLPRGGVRRDGAGGFLLETSTGKLYINEINTIPASLPSACTPRCGSTAACRFRRCSTG